MMQREVLIPHLESFGNDSSIVSYDEYEIIEMCSFVEAVRQSSSHCANKDKNLYQKLLDYKKLKRRISKSAVSKFEYLNLLLESNGCYNDYANTRAVTCGFGKIKRVLDDVVLDVIDYTRNNIYYNISEETIEWIVNNAIWKAVSEGRLKERQLRNVVVFVKYFNAQECRIGNYVDRLFYNCNKYDDKSLLYYLPVVKGSYANYEKVRDAIVSVYIQQLRAIKERRSGTGKYKQTIFCTPVWVDDYPSNPLVKKVW